MARVNGLNSWFSLIQIDGFAYYLGKNIVLSMNYESKLQIQTTY